MATPGYSGTPLAKKLGIKTGSKVFAVNPPKDYRDWLAPLPEGVTIIAKAKPGECSVVHLFAPNMAEIERSLAAARKAMMPNGMLWVSWFKQASKIPTDVTENRIRERLLKTDLVDVKVCAVSEAWSGLGFMVRKELR